MLRILLIFFITIYLTSCNAILPGMKNLNTQSMQRAQVEQTSMIKPTLVPITATLIRDKKISLYIYHVAPADILHISVWMHPEFNIAQNVMVSSTSVSSQGAAGQGGYLVNPYGQIYFPLVGNIRVAGLTIDEIRTSLKLHLKKYIKSPEINVRVADFRGQKMYVFGEVNKPGLLPLNDQPLTIVDALTMTGGLDTSAADPKHIYIIRGNMSRPTVYWLNAGMPDALLLAEHFNLQPGDILYVSSAVATQWNRVLAQLLPTILTVWNTQSIIKNS